MKRDEFQTLPVLVQQYLVYIEAIKGHSELSIIEYASDLRTFFRFIMKNKNLVPDSIPDEEIDLSQIEKAPINLNDEKERALALKLMQFDEALHIVAKEGTPHILCAYLYELAGIFSSFYEICPILTASSETLKLSRLKLALLTSKIRRLLG